MSWSFLCTMEPQLHLLGGSAEQGPTRSNPTHTEDCVSPVSAGDDGCAGVAGGAGGAAPKGEAQAYTVILIPDYGCFRLKQQFLGQKLRVLVCSEL